MKRIRPATVVQVVRGGKVKILCECADVCAQARAGVCAHKVVVWNERMGDP